MVVIIYSVNKKYFTMINYMIKKNKYILCYENKSL